MSFSINIFMFFSIILRIFPLILGLVDKNVNSALQSKYDFIIVGAGSSGSVLARRLSEKWTVLLLEAGKEFDPEIYRKVKTPAGFFSLLGSSVDWNFTTKRQPYACLGKNGKCPYPLGKALGGSSSTNALLYNRGFEYDYNKWGENGSNDWRYLNVSYYFNKIESNKSLLSIQEFQYKTPLATDYIRAAQEKGFVSKKCDQIEQNCAWFTQNTIKGPVRWSAYNAYLENYDSRNLTILTNAFVTKLILKSTFAEGVVFDMDGHTYTASPKKEIILSAGSINSPKILLLSGIGPSDHLESLGINVIKDLPVGKNLQDHTRVALFYKTNSTYPITTEDVVSNKSMYLYNNYGYGPLATTGIEGIAFYKSEENSKEPPDVQLLFASFIPETSPIPAIAATVTVLRPRSVGYVKLQNSNPYSEPVINPNFFDNNSDFNKTIQGLKMAHQIINSKSMVKYNPQIIDREFCKVSNSVGFEELLVCTAKFHTQSDYHPVGTVRMGDRSSKASVVDSTLKVIGIERLRVVDASIAPFLPSANTNSMALMIGEKASDIILNFYKEQ